MHEIRVLYDQQIFSLQPYGGISRYFSQLTAALRLQNQVHPHVVSGFSQNRYLNKQSPLWLDHGLRLIPARYQGKLLERINREYLKWRIPTIDFDLFHPTYYNPYFIPHIKNKPFVLTVFDMIHEIFRDQFPVSTKLIEQKKFLCDRARQIITISANTRNDLLRIYDLPSEKVHVVHFGPPDLEQGESAPLAELRLPDRFLLYVSHRGQYKNFLEWLHAIAPVLHGDPGLKIVAVGGGSFNEQEQWTIHTLKIYQQVIQITPGDRDLAMIFQRAIAFVYPSLYEGFGLPILEAFLLGCPVVCSDTSCFPEVAGDAAVYFDPRDADSMRLAIGRVLADESLRQDLIRKGRQRVQEFSWAKAAEQTTAVYRLALQS